MLSRRAQALCCILRQYNRQPTRCGIGQLWHLRQYASAPGIEKVSYAAARRRPIRRYVVFGILVGGIYSVYSFTRDKRKELNQDTFVAYNLQDIKRISPTLGIFTLRPLEPPIASVWNNSAILQSIQIKHPALQIARSYTPLPPVPSAPSDDAMNDDLRFLIRKEKGGEMSEYLHSLTPGARVEVRGPFQEYPATFSPTLDGGANETFNEVVVLAGGTGISTALQTMYALLYRALPGADTRVKVLWAVRSTSECPREARPVSKKQRGWLGFSTNGRADKSSTSPDTQDGFCPDAIVKELESWKDAYPGRLEVSYYVDEERRFMTSSTIQSTITDSSAQDAGSQRSLKKIIVVSGPDGFVSYIAGPKKWAGGREVQGLLGGALRELKVKEKGWEVWKT